MNTFAEFRQEQVESRLEFLNQSCQEREKWIRRNRYYYKTLYRTIAAYVPAGSSLCHIGCDSSSLLKILSPAGALGICFTESQCKLFPRQSPENRFIDFSDLPTLKEKFDCLVISSLGYFFDIQELLNGISPLCHPRSRILIVNYNFLWEPFFSVAEKIGLRMPQPIQRQNMIPTHQVVSLLDLANFQTVKWSSHLLLPLYIPLLSSVLNRFLAPNFPLRYLASTDVIVARPLKKPERPIRCSVIVPCKNEAGHIEDIVARMPPLADGIEIVLVDDRSTDGTGDEMRRLTRLYPQKAIRIVEGPGISKAEAVRTGCQAATGDLLATLDADLAVAPEELPKCIQPLLDGVADFVNTVRFIYPQQDGAMRWLNIVGNRFFAFIFTFLLRQRVGDTLCGTKIFWKEDYKKIDALKDSWIWRDRWGDFEQLLGASKIGLKIVDVPVHYTRRVYGETKMTKRLKNGLLMLKICLAALFKLRFS